MVINKKELNNYFRNVKKGLKYSFNIKQQLMKSFKNQIYEFIEINENVSIEDIINEFGDSKNISFNLKEEELSYYKKKAKIMLIIEISTIILLEFVIIFGIILIDSLGFNSNITIKK